MFVGEYRYSLEEKGRLFIPVEFRRELLPEAQDTFVATRGYDKCIAVYPSDIWRERERVLLSYPYDTPDNRWRVRHFTSHAKYMKVDRQGRVNIPQHLLDYGGLNKEVLIIGVLQAIELWAPDEYSRCEKEFDPSKGGMFPNLKI
jgi:MraZ protein